MIDENTINAALQADIETLHQYAHDNAESSDFLRGALLGRLQTEDFQDYTVVTNPGNQELILSIKAKTANTFITVPCTGFCPNNMVTIMT